MGQLASCGVPLWLITARAALAAGHLVGGMPATLVREEADQWWTLALEIYGNGCVCGRSIKPTIYCKCRLPFVLVCPLMLRYHTHCCRECARYDGRSAQQNRRRRSSHGLECELRYDASARPAVFDLMSDRADETRELRIVKVIESLLASHQQHCSGYQTCSFRSLLVASVVSHLM